MPEYAVTITQIYSITARNEDQAQERAEMLEANLQIDDTALKVRWNWDRDSSETDIQEL
ncbi:hypothetical protein [uncultured Mediterranean phage uvDeep-CGR0-KM14-C182]|jgi:nicotinamide mononucleotide adenylyltransferase|nr:hypothetical protein [uncultured Mediterranean phage uvDeep-CGR0-KM14-C182]